jgi:Mrp family chromosome partitioning ATPase
MELNRLKRILRDRWIVVLVIACLGALGAWAFTGLANQQREARYQAARVLAFQPLEGQSFSDLSDTVEDNYNSAVLAAQELIAEDPTSQITADLARARLIFTALGNTEAEATAKSRELLDAFLDVDPLLGGADVDVRLQEVQDDATRVQERLAELDLEISPQPDSATQQQMGVLDLEIGGLETAVQELTTAAATAPPAERAEIAARLAETKAELQAKVTERAGLPTGEPGTPTALQQLELTALQAQLVQLQDDYQRLYLRKLGYTDNAQEEPVEVINLSAGPGSGLVNAGIGFLGGLAVALFGLIFINNSRKTLWLPEDLGVPLLADVPGRRTLSGVGQSWYDNTGGSPRKTAIQALRSGVEARLAGTPGAVAIAGHRTGAPAVHALVTDLAVSMASAGASVLLVDADLESDAALAEYQIGGPSLSAVLKLSPDSLLLDREVGNIIAGAYTIRPNLSVLPSGPPPPTPADALAGRQFRAFVQEASKRFDYVVVAVGDARSTAAQVAMQRIGRSAVVITPGRSTEPQLTKLISDITARQVTTLGAIFVQRSEGPVQSREAEADAARARVPETQSGPAASPLTRLSNYPFSSEKGAAVPPSSSLRSLADRVGSPSPDGDIEAVRVDKGDDHLGSDLLGALSEASPAEAYEAVADYLVTRVEDMMVAVPGQAGFLEGLTGELHDSGFVPLRSVPSHRSVGTWLADELHREAPGTTSDGIVHEMERILGFGSGSDSMAFDDWLATEFFARHLRRTGGEPFVWHLSSEEGTTQLFAHATRFDRTSIEIVMSDVTRRTVERLERDLKASNAGGYAERSKGIERHLSDVRNFEVALGWLIGIEQVGADGRKRPNGAISGWNPDWNLGFRENLAPIQRAGLLPFPVLSEEEMDSFLVAG